jgi:hypothetical protein
MKILTLLLSLLFCANTQALAATKPRFKLTAGMGTGVCEAYLKHLNALPANESPPICEVKLSPKYRDIKLPQFELLDWKEHLELIYKLETTTYLPSEIIPKKLSFDDWKPDYLERVKSGEFKPQLRRGKATLNELGSENVIEYDRRISDCDKNSKYGGGGSSYFVLIDGEHARLELIHYLPTRMIVFRGRSFFVNHYPDVSWSAEIYKAHPSWPGKDPNERRYVLDISYDICRLRLTK